MEEMVAAVWAAVLKVERVGTRDNFFDLGGHSLLAARLLALVERHLERRVPLSTFLEAPTIEDLARALRS
jgi:acyl carrier protein